MDEITKAQKELENYYNTYDEIKYDKYFSRLMGGLWFSLWIDGKQTMIKYKGA